MSENIFRLLLQYRNCSGHIMHSSGNTYKIVPPTYQKFFKSIVCSSNQISLHRSYQDMITWRDSLCCKQYLGCVDHSRTALSTIRQQWFCRRIWNGDINYPSVILDTSLCISTTARRRRNNRFWRLYIWKYISRNLKFLRPHICFADKKFGATK